MSRDRNRIVLILIGFLAFLLMGCTLVTLARMGQERGIQARQTLVPPTATRAAAVVMEPTLTALPPLTVGGGDTEEALLVALYERVNPSVVNIRIRQRVEGLNALPGTPDDLFQEGQGSGFVWDQDGHIVTNNHVVANAERVWVTFSDDIIAEAEVVGVDQDSDLAVLKVDLPPSHLQPVAIGDSDALKVGQRAVAIGNPFGQAGTMTRGIISALGRTFTAGESRFAIPEMIQTDAAINPGNSGGPLLDSQGRVIGVANLIISRSGSSSGVGFAVPINIVRQVIPVLIEKGKYTYPWLGIEGTDLAVPLRQELGLPSDQRGALISRVTPSGPADTAGLRGSTRTVRIDGQEWRIGGDIIIAIDGRPVKGIDDVVVYLVRHTQPDQQVELTILREGVEQRITVTLDQRPASETVEQP